jgi:ribosomal protein S18 acetylase RimI-like enzyme
VFTREQPHKPLAFILFTDGVNRNERIDDPTECRPGASVTAAAGRVGAVAVRWATAADAPALHAALAALSRDLGDEHRASEEALAAACFGPSAFASALLSEAGGNLVGVALIAPIFSTTRGAAGVYLSDLWVDPAWRGARLGRRLLAEVARHGDERWGATFIKLAVYDENPGAARFYQTTGFAFLGRERNAILEGDALRALIGETG